MLDNLQKVQREAQLALSPSLERDTAMELEGAGDGSWEWPSFTVEMETGTGKTYVYLRTMLELRQRCGFSKFIVVVPSVAIYEGVVKSFEITREHLRSLYGNEPVNLIRYEGAQLSRLRSFAQSTTTEILVMTLDSFNRASGRQTNVIFRPSERLPGELKPYQFIQGTRPILILDEPQNMGSDLAKSALATLHPLFSLRYSATHREVKNLVHRLTPFEAFQRGLVKRIQVWGITSAEDYNRPFLELVGVSNTGGIHAKVRTWVMDQGQTREETVTLKDKVDLFAKTRREEHKRGYVVAEIHVGQKWLRFENGVRLDLGGAVGPSRPEIFATQIEQAVKEHLSLQERLRPRGIKVLSLFFVDRVASYTDADGLVKTLFDKTFKRLRKDYPEWAELEPRQVREAYFATKTSKAGEEAVDLTLDEDRQNKEEREAARRAFELIMRKKEELLSFDNPVSFIFAHSALKEGWDNPNVFQICTLNQTTSEIKKRQEIGRGLRLCVNQAGERVWDEEVNVLTVVANQSYQSYASTLQAEYRDAGEAADALPEVRNARQAPAKRNEVIFRKTPEFKEFWNRLSQKINYRIKLDTDALVEKCVARISYLPFPEAKLVLERGHFVVHRYRFTLESVKGERARIRLEIEDTRGGEPSVSVHNWERGQDLGAFYRDPRLRGYRVAEVAALPEPHVTFDNGVTLSVGAVKAYDSEEGQNIYQRQQLTPAQTWPVFNLIDRVARETGLTRHTINRIFKGIRRDARAKIFQNPEGFSNTFLTEIRSVLGDEIAKSIEFEIAGTRVTDLEALFPKEKRLAEREQVEGGARGLYDLIQAESGPERQFVEQLKADREVVLFFKFPADFKVPLPRLIGNYNPDWGVVRKDPEGKLTLHLIRETKGTEDLRRLQFPHEKRKIDCAVKYFNALGMDYRVIRGDNVGWWRKGPVLPTQLETDLEGEGSPLS
ncbi:MAG: DEAD/DEAH box helicase family protein [Gemmatimonadetes bacterium]|nr:DEAD/DEAH box helicase family protein [Gemmatimonadota bacterium]